MTQTFRAWDDLNKCWLMNYSPENNLGFSLIGECVLFGEWGNCYDQFLFNKDGKEPKHLIIEQAIGLTDDTGRHIYVGDNLIDDKGNKYNVFEVNGGFAINTHQSDFGKPTPFYESTADMQTSSFITAALTVFSTIHDVKEKEPNP